jgi:hypothetical protein
MAVILGVGAADAVGNTSNPHHEYFGIDDVEYIVDGHDGSTGTYFVQVTLKSSRVFYLAADFTSQGGAVAAVDVLAKAVGLVEIPGL